MVESKKQKTTQVDLQKNFQNDWKDIVFDRNKPDFKFWDESWNECKD